jgi:hypothetical protein
MKGRVRINKMGLLATVEANGPGLIRQIAFRDRP